MRKRRKERIKGFRNKYVLCISAVIMLNIMGITYAGWSDGLNISGLIFCGNLIPHFNGIYIIDQLSENDRISVRFEDVDMDGFDDVMYVVGEIEEGSSPVLNFKIRNAGTMPMKYKNTLENTFQIFSDNIVPQQETEGQINVINLLSQNQEEQIYTIPFVQWNAR